MKNAQRFLWAFFARIDLFYEFSHDFNCENNISDRAATREVGNRITKTLEYGAGDIKAGDMLEGFVKDIT